ncbi:MAG: OmpA family protein [Halioglobus sp.]|nr:OmpA family protein [Halioglobus sp.]
MKKHLLNATAAGLALAGAAFPAAAELPITLNAGAGYWFFEHELFGLEVDDTSTPFVGAEWAFDEHWAAEILFADAETDLENGTEADVTTWQLGVLYYGDRLGGGRYHVRPYAALGGGEIDLDTGSFDSVETTANGGVGVRWMLSDRVGLRLEARAVYSFDENDTDLLTSAGVNFYLGDVDAAGAGADGTGGGGGPDSDGDGVADDRDRCPDTPSGTRVDADGCPLPVAQVTSVKLKVNFDFDSSAIEERYFSDLGELAGFLQRFPDLQVEVEGHTDSTGPESYNMSLSQRRAQAVVDYLVNQHGIAAGRLQAQGYGESRPVAGNDTPEGRAQNRRVMASLEVEYEQ